MNNMPNLIATVDMNAVDKHANITSCLYTVLKFAS